jgi:hypothetical protein
LDLLNGPVTLPSEPREFLVCMDTCGLDTRIDEKSQKTIIEMVQFYAKQWEKTELKQFN